MTEPFTFACWVSKSSSGEWYHIIIWQDAESDQIQISVDNEECLTDEKAYWNRALTEGERKALFSAGQGEKYNEHTS